MVVHVVLMRFPDRIHADEAVRLARELPERIAVIRRLDVGVNLVPSANAFDVGLVVEVDDLTDLERYRAHPAHEQAAVFFRAHRSAVASIDIDGAATVRSGP